METKYNVENYYNYMLDSIQVVAVVTVLEEGFSVASVVVRLSSFCACSQNSSGTWSPLS